MKKAPRQARSRQMVERLLQATARTVAERGLAATTTNHIAARAGVSVGSLYQYFGDKESLLDALSEQLSRDLAQRLNRQLQSRLDDDVRDLLHALLTTVFEYFDADNGLYLELVRHWHHPRTERAINLLEQHLLELVRLYFLRHYDRFRFENLPAVLFVAFNSAVFTGVRYLSQPSPYLRRDEVIGELVTLLAGYLQPVTPPAPGGRQPARLPRRKRSQPGAGG